MTATKFLAFVLLLLAAVSLAPAAGHCSGNWVKLNTHPVCFGAKNNDHGDFSLSRSIDAAAFKLVYASGSVSCNRYCASCSSNWGCGDDRLFTVLTDDTDQILMPACVDRSSNWFYYYIPGYTSMSSDIVYCAGNVVRLSNRSVLRLWYSEDLNDRFESDNGGRTCADVYALPDL